MPNKFEYTMIRFDFDSIDLDLNTESVKSPWAHVAVQVKTILAILLTVFCTSNQNLAKSNYGFKIIFKRIKAEMIKLCKKNLFHFTHETISFLCIEVFIPIT